MKKSVIKIGNKKETQKTMLDLGGKIDDLKFLKDVNGERTMEMYNQTWSFKDKSLNVCIISTPFADYIEIEGSDPEASEFAKAVGLTDSPVMADNYFVEYATYCSENGLSEKDNIVFF